jgi:flagellum-specific peptidoglycan hydrolase FlgJ
MVVSTLVVMTMNDSVNHSAEASTQTDFINMAGQAAQPSQIQYQVPASVTVAQAILESGWGAQVTSVSSVRTISHQVRERQLSMTHRNRLPVVRHARVRSYVSRDDSLLPRVRHCGGLVP